MHNRQPRHQVCSFVPPYLLESIAEHGTARERQMAMDTIATDQHLRHGRRNAGTSGETLSPSANSEAPHKNRRVYTAANKTTLPGAIERSEGDTATGDAAVDEAYDGLGGTFDLFWEIFERDSIDGNGMDLLGTVHYGKNYNNAFWDGSQMVFGDGDGIIFNRFTIAVDVEAHELAHGVTGATAALEYQDQAGALNESVSDCFGAMVKQRRNNQTSEQADWLIGSGLLADGINGVGLRSMKAPGTAYDDPKLGKDPQPDHMDRFVETESDNGGVHINSGIPNKAFYLAAIGLGGNSWEQAGSTWYATLTDSRLTTTASFLDFAKLTAQNAETLHGQAARDIVVQGWKDVGIDVDAVAGGGTDPAEVAGWQYGKKVLSTYASPHSMNAWAFVEDVGWRKIAPLSVEGVGATFALLAAAQNWGHAVHVELDGSLIQQAYSVSAPGGSGAGVPDPAPVSTSPAGDEAPPEPSPQIPGLPHVAPNDGATGIPAPDLDPTA